MKLELGCSPAAVGPTASSVIASAPMVAGSSRADRSRRPSLPAPCSFALPSNKEPRPLTLDPAYKRELERSPAAVGSTASPVLPAPRSVQQEPRAPRELQLPRARCSIWPAPPVPRGRCSKCESEAPPAALVRCLAEPSPPAPRGRQSTPPAPAVAWAHRSTLRVVAPGRSQGTSVRKYARGSAKHSIAMSATS